MGREAVINGISVDVVPAELLEEMARFPVPQRCWSCLLLIIGPPETMPWNMTVKTGSLPAISFLTGSLKSGWSE
jgi:hypothetical protein